jgi:SAM-dependent methyltransferase
MNVYTANPIDDRELYDRSYFDGYYLDDHKREEMYRQEVTRIMERAWKPDRKETPRILDIGCGVGGFLSTLDDRWEKYGVEPSEFAGPRSAKKGIRMFRSVNVIDGESMDVIVFRGTLQHINFPMEALVQAARVLKPGGMLAILATPDTDSLVYKIWGNLPALDAPRNWVIFGGRSLRNILSRLGYSDIEVLHPYLETPYARPLLDFWKFFFSLFFGWRKFAFPGNQMEIYAVKPCQEQ